jgi:Concanavalin A-like lectin/glucanases superfamily
MKKPLLLLGLALACALWAPAAEASTIIRAPNNLSLARGLVGWWNFDGNTVAGTRVFDASGNGNYGTMTNGPVLAKGRIAQGMSFDGGDDYVDVGTGVNTSGPTGTVAAWIKSTSDTCQTIYSVGIGANSGDLANIFIGNGCTGSLTNELITVAKETNGSLANWIVGYTTSNRAELFDGNWHYLAIVYRGGPTDVPLIYLDGMNKTVTNNDPAPPDYDYGFSGADYAYLGAQKSSNSLFAFLRASLDDVRIYNRALSADEVKRLYLIGAAERLGVVANTGSLAKGLVGWWNFDGNTVAGTRVFDASGNGNYGTMTNGPVLTKGRIEQGMLFDGGDDYVATPGVTLTGDFSLAAWFNADVIDADGLTIAGKQNDGNTYFGFIANTTQINVQSDDAGTVKSFTVPTISIHTWYHFLFTRDSSNNVRVY